MQGLCVRTLSMLSANSMAIYFQQLPLIRNYQLICYGNSASCRRSLVCTILDTVIMIPIKDSMEPKSWLKCLQMSGLCNCSVSLGDCQWYIKTWTTEHNKTYIKFIFNNINTQSSTNILATDRNPTTVYAGHCPKSPRGLCTVSYFFNWKVLLVLVLEVPWYSGVTARLSRWGSEFDSRFRTVLLSFSKTLYPHCCSRPRC